ncbi:tRNA (cytidine(34)-2'-O)-methyltransferase [Corynebacterium sphenisci]|uniref:tRNA (cytidine(34)-2'-O)-methyltransferase n=1 Tax=Corynebacterium sphenisci TaxID=191493 RepID=UPI0009FF833A|nr:tRNA (cytidine(34)-2'-O)-methyltransferase [Corynebacterium sphenisci]
MPIPPAAPPPLHIVFDRPRIPPNTGNAIRMCAGVGAMLHLAGPLGFDLADRHLRRAGLDYHDLAEVRVHAGLDEALSAILAADPAARVFAFTTTAGTRHVDIAYREGDVLLFGTETTGLDEATLADPRIIGQVRIPMLPGRRSMNLSNSAAVAAYEAWRQLGFPGGV